MCRWKSGARGCRRGSRASGRAGSSAPLRSACVMEKTLWGRAGKYQLTLPQHSKAGPGRQWMGEREHGMDGAMVVSTPRASACSDQPQGEAKRGSAQRPHGPGAANPSFGMLPRKPLPLPSSGSLVSAPWWGKLRLLRGNVRIWQGRISSGGGSGRTAVIYGAWHSHGYIHTHTRTCLIPSFPSPSTL